MSGSLPVDAAIPGCLEHLRRDGQLIVIAPPGAGKTTRLPPAILDELLAPDRQLLLLQPRRLATRAVATRIASERGSAVGEEIGYAMRFERKLSARTRLQVLTEGLLTRRLQEDPFLEGVGAVVLDEFHERSLQADLALALLAQVRREARPDLHLVVMSATLDPGPIERFLGGAPVMHVETRSHPLDIEFSARHPGPDIGQAVAEKVRETWTSGEGHVLAFLPGFGEIRRARSELSAWARERDVALLPLHGSLTWDEQRRALEPGERRKVILATNVAETSVTIDGVDTVIDGGLARILRQDPTTGLDRLRVERISQHAAEQRSGRAARQGPGRAFRLWTRREHGSLPSSESPEITRVDLGSLLLELRAWGVADPREFPWLTPPPDSGLRVAERLLELLGALEPGRGSLTELGRSMARLPAHPRLARLLLEGRRVGAEKTAATMAALLEERDVVLHPGRPLEPDSRSDLLLRLDHLEGSPALDPERVRRVRRVAKLYRRLLGPGDGDSRADLSSEDELRLLLPAFCDRVVARSSTSPRRGRMVGGRGVTLGRGSSLGRADLYLALRLGEAPRTPGDDLEVTVASAIERRWLEEYHAGLLREDEHLEVDPETGAIRASRVTCFLDLPLEEPRRIPVPPERREELVAGWLRAHPERVIEMRAELSAWLTRYHWLRERVGDSSWPEWVSTELGELLATLAPGLSSPADLEARTVIDTLSGLLPREVRGVLATEAPATWKLPSGREATILYDETLPPRVEGRIQELFGLLETPRLAGGGEALCFEILGPNYRPVQRTRDLASFWKNTYPQVRKDLRGRYPKHDWPEDPTTATARPVGSRRPRRSR